MQRHFDGIAHAYYGIVDRAWYDVGYYHKRESELLHDSLPERIALAVDAGCGPGRHTVTLSERAELVIAIDISRRMLQQARAAVKKADSSRVDFILADVRRLPLRDGVADLVLSLEVLEHLPGKERDASTALREFGRVLRRPGKLVIEAPLRRHRWWRHVYGRVATFKEVSPAEKAMYYGETPLSIDHLFLEADIDSSLGRAGFDSARKCYIRFFPSGMVERHPRIALLEPAFERAPLFRCLCREAVWFARTSGSLKEAPD